METRLGCDITAVERADVVLRPEGDVFLDPEWSRSHFSGVSVINVLPF